MYEAPFKTKQIPNPNITPEYVRMPGRINEPAISIENDDTVHIWADGTWCEYTDLDEYLTFMSDDFETVFFPKNTDDLEEFVANHIK